MKEILEHLESIIKHVDGKGETRCQACKDCDEAFCEVLKHAVKARKIAELKESDHEEG